MEIEMTAKTFKQTLGAMAHMAIADTEPAVLEVNRNGMRGQMAPSGLGYMYNVDIPADKLVKFFFDETDARLGVQARIEQAREQLNQAESKLVEVKGTFQEENADNAVNQLKQKLVALDKELELPTLDFGIRSKDITSVMRRIGKNDTVTIRIAKKSDASGKVVSSKFLITFAKKNYALALRLAKNVIHHVNIIESSAKVETKFSEFIDVVDDIVIDADSDYVVSRITFEAMPGGVLKVMQTTVNPTAEIFDTEKGGDPESVWKITGLGKAKTSWEMIKLVKKLVADTVTIEFGAQVLERPNKDTGEPERITNENTAAIVMTFDEGHVKLLLGAIQD